MSEHTITQPSVKRLERTKDERILAGVAGGLGRYFDLTPAVFRLGFVVLTVLGGAGILVYIAAVLVVPKEGEDRSVAEDILSNRRDQPWKVVALGLVAVALLSLLAQASSWPSAGAAWLLVIVAGLALLWTGRRGLFAAVFGVVLALAVAAAVAVVVAFAWFDVSLDDGIGDRVYTPAAAADVRGTYELGIGDLRVDLSRLRLDAPVRVKARLGIGNLKVTVPRNARVIVTSHVKAGQIDALGDRDAGRNARVDSGTTGRLIVDAEVGTGHIDIVRAR